jgi:hypothetical protein
MEELRKALIEVINNSELPFDARYYVLKDVYRDIFEIYDKLLKEYEAAKENESQNEILKKNDAKQITEIKEVK